MQETISLKSFEIDALQRNHSLIIIRPIEPQGKKKDSFLEGDSLALPFKIGDEPLLLPRIEDLPLECPFGREGELLEVETPDGILIKLQIEQIQVIPLKEIDNETAAATGVEAWYDADLRPDGTLQHGESVAYCAGLWDELQATHLEAETTNSIRVTWNPLVWVLSCHQ